MRVTLFRTLAVALAVAFSRGMLGGATAKAQQPTLAEQAIAYVPTEGVALSGPLSVANGRASMGNNSTITAGDKSAQVTLARGGSLRICATTSVHISRDALPLTSAARPGGAPDDAGLMLAIDRGALEAHYPAGRYSDVLLTPDLRILVSGPGTSSLQLRVNRQGDTCVDNRGDNAPYVTVSSLMDGGIYRVQPNQRVLFERGSLQQVVDREAEPCGCPDSPGGARPEDSLGEGRHVGGPSSTPADTTFPTAVSEGLAAPPAAPSTPVVPVGQAHAQVTASLSNDTPPGSPPPGPTPAPPVGTQSATQITPPHTLAANPTVKPPARSGFLGRVGHFFSRIFGRG
jgi:hypothetical protein